MLSSTRPYHLSKPAYKERPRSAIEFALPAGQVRLSLQNYRCPTKERVEEPQTRKRYSLWIRGASMYVTLPRPSAKL